MQASSKNVCRFLFPLLASLLFSAGCSTRRACIDDTPEMLGAGVDAIHMTQEDNAEASKFVIYSHEFQSHNRSGQQEETSWMLNESGEDHVKQIAANLHDCPEYPVVVERSFSSPENGSEYGFPVHGNNQLDSNRRRTVVASLEALGIDDAEQRVVIAPAFAEGITATEGRRAFSRSLRGIGSGGGFGGGFGGIGGAGRGVSGF